MSFRERERILEEHRGLEERGRGGVWRSAHTSTTIFLCMSRPPTTWRGKRQMLFKINIKHIEKSFLISFLFNAKNKFLFHLQKIKRMLIIFYIYIFHYLKETHWKTKFYLFFLMILKKSIPLFRGDILLKKLSFTCIFFKC